MGFFLFTKHSFKERTILLSLLDFENSEMYIWLIISPLIIFLPYSSLWIMELQNWGGKYFNPSGSLQLKQELQIQSIGIYSWYSKHHIVSHQLTGKSFFPFLFFCFARDPANKLLFPVLVSLLKIKTPIFISSSS